LCNEYLGRSVDCPATRGRHVAEATKRAAGAADAETGVEANFPEYAFVDREALLEMAGVRATDTEWVAGFEAMIGDAESKGWVREDDGAIRAHIERSPTQS